MIGNLTKRLLMYMSNMPCFEHSISDREKTMKTVLITGATDGIGLETVKMLGKEGPVSYTHLTLPTIYSV